MQRQIVDMSFKPKNFCPLSDAVIGLPIPPAAKLIYALMLNRALLSQKNGWLDSEGRLYFVYPLSSLAEKMNASVSTVKYNLNFLISAGLLEKKRPRGDQAIHWYIYDIVGTPETSPSPARCEETEKPVREELFRRPVYEPLPPDEFERLREEKKRMLMLR